MNGVAWAVISGRRRLVSLTYVRACTPDEMTLVPQPFKFRSMLPLYRNQWVHVLLTGLGWCYYAGHRLHWYQSLHDHELVIQSIQRLKLEYHLGNRSETKEQLYQCRLQPQAHFCLQLCHLLNNHGICLLLRSFHVLAFDDDTPVDLQLHRVICSENKLVLREVVLVESHVLAH